MPLRSTGAAALAIWRRTASICIASIPRLIARLRRVDPIAMLPRHVKEGAMAALITTPRLLSIGGGALGELPALMARLGLARPLIVTDPFIAGSGILDRATALLGDAGIASSVFQDTVSDPTTEVIAAGVERLNEAPYDSLIAIGGGSPIDTAKGMSVLHANGGQMRDYKVPNEIPQIGLPIIAIPTTAGTGIDSLTHAIEAYVSKRASPYTDGLAKNAMGLIAKNIRTACADPANRAAREAMMLGATTAGMAFSNASVALVHGMSRPIGAFFHVPHGLSNAMLLPEITAFSVPAALDRYADCARAMGVAEEGEGSQAAVARLLDALRALNDDLKVPSPKDYGISKARYDQLLPTMASQAIASGSPANNPRVPSSEEIIELYRRVYG